MTSIVGNELRKTYLKWRTYIGFIAIGVVVPLVLFAFRLEGGSMVKNMTRTLERDFYFVGNLFNGYFITYFVMNSLWIHIPFLISLVAGDQLAGEATGGTFRLILISPTSRSRILFVKYATTLFYTVTLVTFLAVLSVGLGLLLFGSGDLIVPGRVLVILPAAEAPWRLCLAFGCAICSMWCVASLAFLFSSLVENAIGPIVGTMAVIIVFLLVSTIPLDFFVSVRPYLFTTYINVWQVALEEPLSWSKIISDLAILIAFCFGFYLVTWYIFARKDILS